MIDNVHARIISTLAEKGPLLGKELAEALGDLSHIQLWRACYKSSDIQMSHFARYYLRYDVTRENHIRLSPSILRDFLSFTLMSLLDQREEVIERQVLLGNEHRVISLQKIDIAREILAAVIARITPDQRKRFCAFVAGDLAYFLAHDEPREVAALGEYVRGSDIDIIIVHDGLDEELVEQIERFMSQRKYFYLRHPDHRQELDYICKSIDRLFSQFAYGTIREKIASKIAYESLFLAGSIELYSSIKHRMETSGVKELIEHDFDLGLEERRQAMRLLVNLGDAELDKNTENLFFFSQERIEFD